MNTLYIYYISIDTHYNYILFSYSTPTRQGHNLFADSLKHEANLMPDDFHVLPTPKLKQAAKDCPLLEGDSEAWIVCCTKRFFPLARRIAGDDSLAQDALQISWIKILQSVRTCRGGPKACPWVSTIVSNAARDIRRNYPQREVAFSEEQKDPHESPEALAQEAELLRLLREMVVLLPPIYRQVVDLRVYHGLSSRKTAERLHVSPSDVDTRLSRAVEMLKRRLDARLKGR